MKRPEFYETLPNGTLRINFHPGQSRAMRSRARIVAVVAGTQGGKTTLAPPWLFREIYGDPTAGMVGRGPGDYLVATATYDLFKMKLLPAMRDFFEYRLGIGRYWSGSGILELKDPQSGQFLAGRADDQMWARIILRSASSEGGLEAATAKAAVLDEAGQPGFRISAWEAVLRRVALHQGRILIATTPYNLGWLKTEIYDRWAMGEGDIEFINFPSSANPAFPAAEMERARAQMAAWKYTMFYLGRFERPPGLIYGDFQRREMVVQPFALPAHWPRYVALDFGGVNNAAEWFALDVEHGIYYAYNEWHGGGKTVREYAPEVLALQDGGALAGAYGGSGSEDQSRRDWSDAGLFVQQPLVGAVEAGLDRGIALIRAGKLRVFDCCKGLIEDFETYSRVTDDTGEVTDKIANPNDYHFADCYRYFVTGAVEAGTGLVDTDMAPEEMRSLFALE